MAGFFTYKPNQGYWTRTLSLIGGMTVVCAGAGWLWNELGIADLGKNKVYIQGGIVGFMVVAFLFLFWRLLNSQKIAEFMIATESEMKKVAWPSKKEIFGNTWLVIAGTLFMAGLLFSFDFVFAWFFQQIGVLQS